MFSVRRTILEELLADPEWNSKLDRAKTWKEAREIINQFCRSRGYKVVKIEDESR